MSHVPQSTPLVEKTTALLLMEATPPLVICAQALFWAECQHGGSRSVLQGDSCRMSGVRRALLLSTSERYIVLGSNFLTVAIVSRILTPAEIGVSVIGMAIIGMATSVREFASGNYLIQRPNLTRAETRGAFTVMAMLTILVAGGLSILAPKIAELFDEARLVHYLRIVSLCVLVELFTSLITGLQRRDMAFGSVAAVNIGGALVGMASTIVLCLLGFSFMSFAWAWLLGALASVTLALAMRPDFSIFKPTTKHWRPMIEFGGYNGATILLYRSYEAIPYLLLGKLVSPYASALFNRTLMVSQLPDRVFLAGASPVILPAFSASVRAGKDLRQPYLDALGMITAVQWPALVMLAILAHPIVKVVLGDQWLEVVPLVRIVALASLCTFSFELNYPVLVSMGAVRDVFVRALIVCPISAGIVTLAVVEGGLPALAWSMTIVIPFQAYVTLQFVRRRLVLGWSDILVSVSKSGIVALTTVLGPLAMAIAATPRFELGISHAIFAACLSAIGWIGGLWLTGHPLLGEMVKIAPTLARLATPRASGIARG